MTRIEVTKLFDVTITTPDGHMRIMFLNKEENLKDFTQKFTQLEKYLKLCRGMEHVKFNISTKHE